MVRFCGDLYKRKIKRYNRSSQGTGDAMKVMQKVNSFLRPTHRAKANGERLPAKTAPTNKPSVTKTGDSFTKGEVSVQKDEAFMPSPLARALSLDATRPSPAIDAPVLCLPEPLPAEEQRRALNEACAFLLATPRNTTASFSGLANLRQCALSGKKNESKLLVEGLCFFAQGDYLACVDTLGVLLQTTPNSRSALVYQLLASFLGRHRMDVDQHVEIIVNFKENFQTTQDDVLGRLVSLKTMSLHWDWQQIETELLKLNGIQPNDAAILSCLAITSLQTYVGHGGIEKKTEAGDFAYKALKQDKNDDYAFSTLWHSTAGNGLKDLSPLQGSKNARGEYRTVFHCADCDLQAIERYALCGPDPLLRRELVAIKAQQASE